MTAQRIVIRGKRERDHIRAWLETCADLSRVTLDEPKRSFEQNKALWAALDDISEQLAWHGQSYSSKDWKDYFVHSLKRGRWMPDENGGMVPIGMSTSEYSWKDFGDLLEIVHEFGARHGVRFADDKEATAPASNDEHKEGVG